MFQNMAPGPICPREALYIAELRMIARRFSVKIAGDFPESRPFPAKAVMEHSPARGCACCA